MPFLQFLSKAFKGDPRGGGGRTRTLTRASLQAAGANKSGFSQSIEQVLGFGLSLEGKGGQRWSFPSFTCCRQRLSAFSPEIPHPESSLEGEEGRRGCS